MQIQLEKRWLTRSNSKRGHLPFAHPNMVIRNLDVVSNVFFFLLATGPHSIIYFIYILTRFGKCMKKKVVASACGTQIASFSFLCCVQIARRARSCWWCHIGSFSPNPVIVSHWQYKGQHHQHLSTLLLSNVYKKMTCWNLSILERHQSLGMGFLFKSFHSFL